MRIDSGRFARLKIMQVVATGKTRFKLLMRELNHDGMQSFSNCFKFQSDKKYEK